VSGLLGSGLVLQNNFQCSRWESCTDNITIAPGSTGFTFPTTYVNGAGYNVTVVTEPAAPPQVCVVYNGTGPSDISVECTTATEQLIVADGGGNLFAYFIDSRTGSLGVGTPVAVGSGYTQQATDPAGKFLYVLNTSAGTVSAYTASASTGALMPVAGSPFPTSAGADGLVVEPTGRFLYVGASLGEDAYSIDPTTGTLTLIAGSPFSGPPGAVLCGQFRLASAKFLYYTQCVTGGFAVNGFTIDAMTGALTSIGPVGATAETAGGDNAAIDPTNRFFYLQLGSSVQLYTVNALTGALTYVTSLQPPSSSSGWQNIAVDPSGKFAYVPLESINATASSISAFAIDSTTGALTPLPSTALAGVLYIGSPIVFDLTGKFVYVVTDLGISAYAINSTTGALTPVPGSPFLNTPTSFGMAVVQIP
jgi:6-phosphogluconolactonase (cycloisomerase 2 family)